MSALFDPANYAFNWSAVPAVVVGLSAAVLGWRVLLQERASRIGIVFAAVAGSVAWWLASFAMLCLSAEPEVAGRWIRIEHLGVVFIPSLIYIFTLGMVQRWHRYAALGLASLALSAGFAVTVAFGERFIAGLFRFPWSYYPRYGPVGAAFVLTVGALLGASLRLFWVEYRHCGPGTHRQRLRAFLQAFLVGSIGCVDFLGVFGVPCYPFGYLPIFGFLALSARAIRRYHLVAVTPASAVSQILETMQGSIIAVDLEGTIRLCNRSACRLLGYTEAQLQGLALQTIFGDSDDVAGQLAALLRDGAIEQHETRWRTNDGRLIEVTVSASCLSGPDERPLGAVYAAQDITERKRAEAELARRAEELARSEAALRKQTTILQLILDNMSEGVVVADEHGKFLVFNPMAERIVGIGATETEPAQWSERYGVFLADGRTPAPAEELPLVRVIRGAASAEAELFICNPKMPQGVYISASARPLKDERGGLKGGVVVFHDITERKRAEVALRSLNETLERQVVERTAAAEERARELARSNAELQKFAYVASHDLQEPLRAVISYIQLLVKRYRGRLDPDADEFLNFIVAGAARMQQLIRDLLAYSRVGTSGRPFVEADCGAIARSAVENLRAAVEDSHAAIEIDGLPSVMADPLQLGQLFQNLIGNAIKFSKPGLPPRIQIGARRQDRRWVVSVRDHGIGIDPQYTDRLFVLFQRLHTQAEYPGTGIGLAICKKIVERHGGEIWVEAQPGQGSTFFFTLPAAAVAGKLAQDPSEAAGEQRPLAGC